jgi:hypothetical protein
MTSSHLLIVLVGIHYIRNYVIRDIRQAHPCLITDKRYTFLALLTSSKRVHLTYFLISSLGGGFGCVSRLD